MPQLNYNLRSIPGVPGGRYNPTFSDLIESYPAAAVVPFGVAVQLGTDNTVRPLNTSTTGAPPAKMVGCSLFDPAREQSYPYSASANNGAYQVGEMVPVLHRGSIYVLQDAGGTWTQLGTLNVWHSSDASHNQGVFTFTATQSTAGAEIDNVPSWCVALKPNSANAQPFVGTFTDDFGNTWNVGLVSLNFPGKA